MDKNKTSHAKNDKDPSDKIFNYYDYLKIIPEETLLSTDRRSQPEVFYKKDVLGNSQENTCARVSFPIKLQA